MNAWKNLSYSLLIVGVTSCASVKQNNVVEKSVQPPQQSYSFLKQGESLDRFVQSVGDSLKRSIAENALKDELAWGVFYNDSLGLEEYGLKKFFKAKKELERFKGLLPRLKREAFETYIKLEVFLASHSLYKEAMADNDWERLEKARAMIKRNGYSKTVSKMCLKNAALSNDEKEYALLLEEALFWLGRGGGEFGERANKR